MGDTAITLLIAWMVIVPAGLIFLMVIVDFFQSQRLH
jgi:hypothetical protein